MSSPQIFLLPSTQHSSADAGTVTIWVFGYGSLCWSPGFSFIDSCIGYVKGYARKFWQGSVSHRGTELQPGRVVTLVKDNDEAIVWGRAFQVMANSVAIQYLRKRECSYGGYICAKVPFHANGDESAPPLETLIYIADPRNRWWLGEAPLEDICTQIVQCEGVSGHNVEYVLRLAEYMREHIPAETDPELFRLEKLVRQELRQRMVNVNELMALGHHRRHRRHPHQMNGHHGEPCNLSQNAAAAAAAVAITADQESESSQMHRTHFGSSCNYDFTKHLPDKKLRCINL